MVHPRRALFVLVLATLALTAWPQPAAADTARATLVVRLPANATLMVGDNATTATGAERTFQSPPLPAGQDFTYKLTATWTSDGKPRTATRQARVRAGERIVVDFTMPEAAANLAGAPRTRTFEFTYACTVTDLPPDKTARIWLPVPSSGDDQDVEILSVQSPAGNKIAREPQYGNQVLFVEAKSGPDGSVPVSILYRITRREVRGEQPATESAARLTRYLEPDAKVPVGGRPLDLLGGKQLPADPLALGRVLYDVVNGHMRYSKEGTGWGNGDAVWACDSKFGNCSDFHSLFISLARAQKMPAKFEIGFPLPETHGGEIPGYHCWAKFRPTGKGWVAVDISEANKNPSLLDYYFGNLSADRVAFSTGRDIDLVPKQDGPPLNFFIYPYVEVDGAPYAASKVQKKFTFKDVAPAAGK
jgi:uncharacterized protein (TIGR03000 family)